MGTAAVDAAPDPDPEPDVLLVVVPGEEPAALELWELPQPVSSAAAIASTPTPPARRRRARFLFDERICWALPWVWICMLMKRKVTVRSLLVTVARRCRHGRRGRPRPPDHRRRSPEPG